MFFKVVLTFKLVTSTFSKFSKFAVVLKLSSILTTAFTQDTLQKMS